MDETGKFYLGKGLTAIMFGVVLFLLLLNIFSPLRLITDGIRYLNIVEYLDGNLDKSSFAAIDFFPHGYPRLLLLFEKLNLLNPITITIINILSVLLSCCLFTKLFSIENKLFFCLLVLLSFVNIKHCTLSVADQLFTFLLIAGIYLWSEFFNKKYYYIIPALLITAASIYVRTAGIAILPGILLYIFYNNRANLSRRRVLAGIIGMAFFAAFFIFLIKLDLLETKIDYMRQLNLTLMINQPFSIPGRLSAHFKEFGELTLNMPYSKLTGIIKTNGFDTAQYLLVIVGGVALYVLCGAALRLRLFDRLAFWVFLTYLLMIFVWPFYDTRFLIPLVPVFVYLFFDQFNAFIKTTYQKTIPLLVYLLLGYVSLIYSDAISLSKPFFLRHYGFERSLTNDYRIHFENQSDTKNKPVYNIKKDNNLFLLEKYDR